ncbi:MAG: cobalamin biosynthesis protein [Oscillospiraceae bacterium]|nr:cobalamin biosynthesis protein [Oscillospiraceae bacterium]
MKLAVFAYSRRGCDTARRVLSFFPGHDVSLYAPARLEEEGFLPLGQPYVPFYGSLFESCDALIFVGAAGIAVRSIAPHVRDKRTDPAVLCADESGRFVISLLSGHIGGANAMASALADALGATAVVTTATDINRRFSADAWAAENGYAISDMRAAKAVSGAILEGDVPICCSLPVSGELPAGTVPGESGPIGIYIGWEKKEPFDITLRLIPRALHLGIGCRRGVGEETIAKAVDGVLDANGVDIRAVECVSSVDLKADEPGLKAYCENNGLPFIVYGAARLAAVKGSFSSSAFVESVTGVDNVCERAALAEADELLIKKTAIEGVTVALAAKKTEVRFG